MYRHLIPPDSKHWSYRGRYRVGNHPKIHEVTLKTNVKEVAEKLLNDTYKDSQREAAGLIPSGFTRKALRLPVADLYEQFYTAVRKRGGSSDYVRVLKIRLKALALACHWKTAGDVTKHGFLAWRDAQTEYEARTLNHFFDAARVFCNWLDRAYEIPNPLKRVEKLKVYVKHPEGPRAFTEDELKRLFAEAEKHGRLLQYRVFAFTGLRRKELKQLCWGDVRLEEKQPALHLRAEATKARRGDRLPLLSIIAQELKAARPEGWSANMRVLRRGVSDLETLHRDLKHAGIPVADDLGRRAGFHTFRRTFISHLQRCGVHSRVIMQLARHKSLRMTDWTYTDTTLLPLAEGIENLGPMASAAPQSSPSPSPRKFGQKRVEVSKVGLSSNGNKSAEIIADRGESVEKNSVVQTWPTAVLVPGEGLEPTRL
jgi:integrase